MPTWPKDVVGIPTPLHHSWRVCVLRHFRRRRSEPNQPTSPQAQRCTDARPAHLDPAFEQPSAMGIGPFWQGSNAGVMKAFVTLGLGVSLSLLMQGQCQRGTQWR